MNICLSSRDLDRTTENGREQLNGVSLWQCRSDAILETPAARRSKRDQSTLQPTCKPNRAVVKEALTRTNMKGLDRPVQHYRTQIDPVSRIRPEQTNRESWHGR